MQLTTVTIWLISLKSKRNLPTVIQVNGPLTVSTNTVKCRLYSLAIYVGHYVWLCTAWSVIGLNEDMVNIAPSQLQLTRQVDTRVFI